MGFSNSTPGYSSVPGGGAPPPYFSGMSSCQQPPKVKVKTVTGGSAAPPPPDSEESLNEESDGPLGAWPPRPSGSGNRFYLAIDSNIGKQGIYTTDSVMALLMRYDLAMGVTPMSSTAMWERVPQGSVLGFAKHRLAVRAWKAKFPLRRGVFLPY